MRKGRATLKGRMWDFADAFREGDFCKRGTVKKSIIFNCRDVIGEGHADGGFIAASYDEGAYALLVFIGHEGEKRIIRAGEGKTEIAQDAGGAAVMMAKPGG